MSGPAGCEECQDSGLVGGCPNCGKSCPKPTYEELEATVANDLKTYYYLCDKINDLQNLISSIAFNDALTLEQIRDMAGKSARGEKWQ